MARGRYVADRNGVKEIGRMAGVQAECLKVARDMASAANADDRRGHYVAEAADVPSGWDFELRSGAKVKETKRGIGGLRRTLVRLSR